MSADDGAPGESVAAILIVDDEAAIADMVAAVVEDAGYTPIVASHGQHAFALARDRWPALLITDLMMPRMTGTELIGALRAHGEERAYAPMPIILMTAAGLAPADAAGADAILRKPFDLDQLEDLLHRFLDHTAA